MKLVELKTNGSNPGKKQAVLVYFDDDVQDVDFTYIDEVPSKSTALVVIKDYNISGQ